LIDFTEPVLFRVTVVERRPDAARPLSEPARMAPSSSMFLGLFNQDPSGAEINDHTSSLGKSIMKNRKIRRIKTRSTKQEYVLVLAHVTAIPCLRVGLLSQSVKQSFDPFKQFLWILRCFGFFDARAPA
jgi:hypothetical protein